MDEPARICMVSQRGLKPDVARCCAYEFEDTICAMDSADLVVPALREPAIPELADKILRRLRQSMGVNISLQPKAQRVSIEKDYDLLFMVVQNVWDLQCLRFVDAWRKRCRVAVCWIEELWVDSLKWRDMFDPLHDFDHVFLNCHAGVEPLGKLVPTRCIYAPAAVDAEGFCPYPNPPERHIDLYYMGRRSPETHESLLAMARNGEFHYLYDTVKPASVLDPVQHRALLASLIKRSRFFITNRAKVNADFQTHGQEEIGLRFFEGAAAGAVLIGDIPRCEPFARFFDWPDAVIPMRFGSREIGDIVRELDQQPERVARIRKDNMINCLRRHDWVHRWKTVLATVGLEPRPATLQREAHLSELASLIEGEKTPASGSPPQT